MKVRLIHVDEAKSYQIEVDHCWQMQKYLPCLWQSFISIQNDIRDGNWGPVLNTKKKKKLMSKYIQGHKSSAAN